MINDLQSKLLKAGWKFSNKILNQLSDYDKDFIKKEFLGTKKLSYYCKRVKCLDFVNSERILDAACGMGQWAIAFSFYNKNIDCIDINLKRLLIAKSISNRMKRSYCFFQFGSLEKLPYKSNSFDKVFCYGVIMFVDIKKTLNEFHRVLKNNGKLYLNANNLGWYFHLFVDLGIKVRNFNLCKTSLIYFIRSYLGKNKNIIITRSRLQSELIKANYKILDFNNEGQINQNNKYKNPKAAYPSHYYNFQTIIEVLAKKRI